MTSFEPKSEPNNPPLTPVSNSPFTLSGASSHTINVPSEDHVEVFFRTSDFVSEQVALTVNGSQDYYYYDLSGSRTAPDSSVPLADCSALSGTRLTIDNTVDGQYTGGTVRVPLDGGSQATVPAHRWKAYDAASNGPITQFTILNREGTSNIGFTAEVYARP